MLIPKSERIARVVITIFLILLAIICVLPMVYELAVSFSTESFVTTGQVTFWPVGFSLGSYKLVLNNPKFWISIRNSVLYVIVGCVLMLFTTMSVAYPLTRPNLKCRKLVNLYLIIPMYVGGGIIPEFILMTKLGLYNSPLALILPGSYAIWYIILVRSYFRTIPESLRESAKIDGANSFRILWNVFLPTSKPILAVIALYTIIGVWNSWYHASIYITDRSWQPLQLYLRRILVEQTEQLANTAFTDADALRMAQEQQISNNQLKYTIIIVSSLPMLIAYPFFQNYFVKGVMLGSLKE